MFVQFARQELHEAGTRVEVFEHPGLLTLAQIGKPLDALPKCGRERRGGAFPMIVQLEQRRGRFERKQFQRVIQPATRSVQFDLQFTERQSVVRGMEACEQSFNQITRRKSRLDEVIRDVAVATATEKHSERIRQRTPSASDLLIVMHDGTGKLVVNDEGEIGFVEAHAERGGGDESFQFISEQTRF